MNLKTLVGLLQGVLTAIGALVPVAEYLFDGAKRGSEKRSWVIDQASGRPMQFHNTNYLVAQPDWNIGLQKTGFINEAGRCLVMQAMIQGRNVVMVFLDSKGKMSRTADAGRMRKWLEAMKPPTIPTSAAAGVPVTVSAAATAPSVQ